MASTEKISELIHEALYQQSTSKEEVSGIATEVLFESVGDEERVSNISFELLYQPVQYLRMTATNIEVGHYIDERFKRQIQILNG